MMHDINIGMSDTERDSVIELLKHILADTYLITVKTQNFHWNVTGPLFPQLHQLFESQYNELNAVLDTLAERIRALGGKALGSFSSFLAYATLDEAGDVSSPEAMLAQLLDDHESMIRAMRESFDILDEAGDEVTLDLFVQRMACHEKTAWMLRSSLE
jgi:starvation-inducible DNA-binding protein